MKSQSKKVQKMSYQQMMFHWLRNRNLKTRLTESQRKKAHKIKSQKILLIFRKKKSKR